MGEDECTALINRVLAKPLRWTADTLAWRIGLTDATRTLLKITTIGATDCNKAQRAERRRQQDASAHRARRAARHRRGQGQPWELQGISRATWYRRGKPAGRETVRQNPSTADRAVYAVDGNRLTAAARPGLWLQFCGAARLKPRKPGRPKPNLNRLAMLIAMGGRKQCQPNTGRTPIAA
jgi:hypothetical protein